MVADVEVAGRLIGAGVAAAHCACLFPEVSGVFFIQRRGGQQPIRGEDRN